MTAIVGVLNKCAIAIAADSAVTLGNTHKVLNTGNKLFALSKYAPVGIGTYGNADFMNNPWEVIIKQYRRKLGENKYPKLKNYADDFLKFLREQNYFSSDENRHKNLRFQMEDFYDRIEKDAKENVDFEKDPTSVIEKRLTETRDSNKTCTLVYPELVDYEIDSFTKYAQTDGRLVAMKKSYLTTVEQYDLFLESFFYYMRVNTLSHYGEAGLVIFGYGEDELYPCLYELKVTSVIEDRLQYNYGEFTEITNDGDCASIIPFAQTNVAQTIIRGINPTFYDIMGNVFNASMIAFRQQISDVIRKNPHLMTVADAIDKIDPIPVSQNFNQQIQDTFRTSYTQPLVNTITNLGIEDMANVAESFVSLTSLVKRMSPGEETVGGPVDVAVVSKGDGLIWIKRKHYFKPELNTHFFSNYYND